MKNYIKHHPWKIIEENFHPGENKISESVFSLGNGKFGQRGIFEEYFSGDSLQGNYISGIYYPDKTRVGWWKIGYPEYFAKVLNAPDWTGIKIKINGNRLDLGKVKFIAFTRTLDMQEGSFSKDYIAELPDGKQVQVRSKRIISIADDEIAAIKYQIKPLNFAGAFELESSINGNVKNEDANYNEQFWNAIGKSAQIQNNFLINETKKTKFRVCYSMHNEIHDSLNKVNKTEPELIEEEMYIAHKFRFSLSEKQEFSICKYVALTTSMYYDPNDIKANCYLALDRAKEKKFDKLLEDHKNAWSKKWENGDIIIDGDVSAQQAIRFNIFQLNQTYTGKDERLNIGPKGFTGEKYGGSTYWDTEAYCLPFYLSSSDQSVARNLLKYRYKHLKKAIENAQKLGLKNGAALYPMVTMNGEECHNEWEITFEEIHRNAAIAYAIYNYVRYTEDEEYLSEFGLEVLIGIARFWAERVNYSEKRKKYVILGVTGPNEYENNVNNNWYTNFMAQWTLEYCMEVIRFVKNKTPDCYERIVRSTKFNAEKETKNWKKIAGNLYLPYDEERKVFLQQDGFLDKEIQSAEDLSPDERPLNQNWSWDKILRSCFIKQADVLQGFFFHEDKFDLQTMKRNYDFYEPMTVHESSLSASIHSILAARLAKNEKAYEFYLSSSRLDLDDYNNDTEDGLHITSMGGTWMTIVYGFAGLRIRENKLSFHPFLPKKWKSFGFKIKFRKHLLHITIQKTNISIKNTSAKDISILLFDKPYSIQNGKSINVEINL